MPDNHDLAPELISEAAESLERLVATVLRDHDPAPAEGFLDGIVGVRSGEPATDPMSDPAADLAADLAADPAADYTVSVLLGLIAGWLVSARDSGLDPAPVLAWVSQHLGADAAIACYQVSGFVGHPRAPELTVSRDRRWLRYELFPALIWLAAGVCATAGAGDAFWLRQFDASRLAS